MFGIFRRKVHANVKSIEEVAEVKKMIDLTYEEIDILKKLIFKIKKIPSHLIENRAFEILGRGHGKIFYYAAFKMEIARTRSYRSFKFYINNLKLLDILEPFEYDKHPLIEELHDLLEHKYVEYDKIKKEVDKDIASLYLKELGLK